MKLNPNSFFYGKFREINLNNFFSEKGLCDSSKPQDFQKELNKLRYSTYGGYGENRKDIFKNSYLNKTKKYYHLGIDINEKAGMPVNCPFDCIMMDRFIDKDKDIGWGGRLILGILNIKNYNYWVTPFLVLAHLNPKTMIGKKFYVNKGEILGYIGTYPENGNTFEHLHVQCIMDNDFKNFDGYGTKKDLKDNPNPFEVEF